jgi:hypothetical protein
MRTFPARDSGAVLRGIEVEHIYISRGRLGRVLSSVEGVASVRKAPRIRRREGYQLDFELGGVPYTVWEPYGDSSRYWIGPCEPTPGDAEGLAVIDRALRQYQPPFLVRLLGDLLSLNFKAFLRRG